MLVLFSNKMTILVTYTQVSYVDKSMKDIRNHVQQLTSKLTPKQGFTLLKVLQDFTDVFGSKPGLLRVERQSVKAIEDFRQGD